MTRDRGARYHGDLDVSQEEANDSERLAILFDRVGIDASGHITPDELDGKAAARQLK